MMMTGKINSRSNVLSTIGKTNAATISSAGSPYLLSRATPLLPASLHRRAIPEQARGPEHKDHDEHGEDHYRGPPDAYVLVCQDRKSTRLNSSHANISYAVFCLK